MTRKNRQGKGDKGSQQKKRLRKEGVPQWLEQHCREFLQKLYNHCVEKALFDNDMNLDAAVEMFQTKLTHEKKEKTSFDRISLSRTKRTAKRK